ncbi:MAG: glutaminyl-tRNA synthase (glutamine-hydrolyzing) subunit B [Candidatus Buchananbacteria bacterium RIFCSPLOWO2_02_FULL_46_11b]|uniref:Aspartyl/glutamyl-tRNA(Asn/Gln) amidotransferase subunit B n=1 Tax=Candidatus Buchananbacteria bacterium RIFCSPLOWO2_02_FULL_46_11b TaxID=1797548 RepID=A0A1G1YU11_9BACT|nr:MAG: glutaminyl-tRNA synthase (glutamine-hydrolyzing) subunit B [Candidatus Buchananbacteria bacterium RIFCSPLOWO2_02_FULL_46_11b]
MTLTPIIGLEIHVQLKTKSKMFCRCDNSGENQPPNTTVCPVCLGQPGTLPVANRQAIAWSAMAALALNCEIPAISKFDRKSYFYPDLPKGYQISQFDQPIGLRGFLEIETKDGLKKISINRLHLEEDAAKNFHSVDGKNTLVDYNRSSTPLMEIVTEPDLRAAAQAKTFVQELRLIMRYLDVSDADMEKGHLRCDANISLTDQLADKIDYKKLSPKTEVKNINSFRAVEKAIEYEIKRQTELWQEGQAPKIQSTRGWNEDKGVTEEQRTKEEASDYRYFPEPDLPPINFTPGAANGFDLKKIKASLPELPQDKRKRFIAEYGLTVENARILIEDKNLAAYFEQAISELRAWLISLDETEGTQAEIWEKNKAKLAKLAGNWLLNKLLAVSPQALENVAPENFAEFITLIHGNKINSTIAQKLLEKMVQTKKDPSVILDEEGLDKGVEQKDIETIIDQIISQNQKEVEAYKQGKTTLLQFFIGQAMRQTKGQADPETLKNIITGKLNN